MNLKPELRKHYFPDCPFANDNEFCQKAFINVCGLVSGWRKKSQLSDTASQATRDLAMNRLEAILGSSEDQLEDADIESDDESSVKSHPDFPRGDGSVHKPSSQR